MQLTFAIPAVLLLSFADSGLARTVKYHTVVQTVVRYRTTVTVMSPVKTKGCILDTFKVFVSENGWSCTHPNGDQIGPRPKPSKPTDKPTPTDDNFNCPPSKIVTATAKNCPAVRCAASRPEPCIAYDIRAEEWDCRCKTRKGTVSTYTLPCPSCCPSPPRRYWDSGCMETPVMPSLPTKGTKTPTQITIVEPPEPTREPGESPVKSKPTDETKEKPIIITESDGPDEKDVEEPTPTPRTKEEPKPTDTEAVVTEAPEPKETKDVEPEPTESGKEEAGNPGGKSTEEVEESTEEDGY
ncbi:hypothetical protein TWF106_011231 [Orbilia oligospora]|uniref:Uncharacterized protein n=1 Tax=Orbilia oligospora TaxID=2813651 RepID=A0A6G1MI31_ORBOL|nr:hypothetical protein TWF788_004484 [Orbilia oligospora]KAF3202314.1 hypothetical protein TWF679_010871 [Orbilia oligospora]KAF3226819.1 hypothetical protein TWF106_011231 [Orbilia oligospora]KAF3229537.1 hypothetical protein TWF191_001259 [Orbilia oligospora]KAF3258317.1 hypothetical protein TWF192_000448 [Orbilia oligospora]